MPRYVIGHDHIGILHVGQRSHDSNEVNVTVVGIDLHEAIPLADDVAELDVKDLLLLAEGADQVVDLLVRILKPLGDRSDAEIESVIGAFHRRG